MSFRYSMVVPVFNEKESIGPFCEAALTQLPPGYELLICYDYDGDTTLPALVAIPDDKKPQNIRLVLNTLGRGVRYAIEAGLRQASAPVIIVSMVDLSDDYRCVPEMVSRIENGASVVCASRYMKGGQQIGGPWFKGMLSWLAGVSLHYLTGLPTHDPTNSFKAYSKAFIESVKIESEAGFSLGLELTVKAHKMGLRVEELPATWRDRTAGKSNFKLWKWMPQYLKWYFYAFWKRRQIPSNQRVSETGIGK